MKIDCHDKDIYVIKVADSESDFWFVQLESNS